MRWRGREGEPEITASFPKFSLSYPKYFPARPSLNDRVKGCGGTGSGGARQPPFAAALAEVL